MIQAKKTSAAKPKHKFRRRTVVELGLGKNSTVEELVRLIKDDLRGNGGFFNLQVTLQLKPMVAR